MKLFQRTAKDGNELGDLLEPEKKPLKAASERADGKDLLPGIGASLLGVAAAGALLWFGVFGGAGEAQQRQLDAAWAEGQAGALRQALQQLAADTRAAAASPLVLEALQSGDAARIEAAQRSLLPGFAVQGIGLITENGVLGLGRSAVVFAPRSFGSTAYEALYGNDFM